PLDGMCKGSMPQNAGMMCNANDPCQIGGMCDMMGKCVGQPKCAPGTVCVVNMNVASCVAADVVPQLAKPLSIAQFNGLAQAPDGTSFVAGPYFPPAAAFDGINASQAGGADALVVKYDPGTKKAVWTKSLGDAADQLAYGVSITQDGTVGVLGTFQGVINTG